MSMQMKRVGGMLVLVAMLAVGAEGGIVTFGLVEEFSGGTPPAGTVPPAWLTVTVDDGADVTDGIVTLTLAATNLTGSEKVKEWYLNLDSTMDPDDLVFTNPSKTGAFATPTYQTEADAYKADGDGLYDILFSFTHSGNATQTFGAGDSIAYTVQIDGSTALEAASFDFLSKPAGGHGPYPTAAHVQSIGAGEDSGWVTTPEPATLGMLAAGLAGAVFHRRKHR